MLALLCMYALELLFSLILTFLCQATIRPPVIRNMEKALWFQFVLGGLPLYAVVFMGYWAYGSSTSTYLLNSVNGPSWLKAIANIAAFLQTVIALHVLHSNLIMFFYFLVHLHLIVLLLMIV